MVGMKTLYVGGEHEVRCDGFQHWVYPSDGPRRWQGDCDCQFTNGPAFTKQHYEAIAETLLPLDIVLSLGQVIEALADTFARDNPRFEREKFYKACWEGKEQSDVLS